MPESLPLRVLPFRSDSFDWNRFESFCLSVVRSLREVKRADRYGDTGEDQQGIDIEADLHDGRKRTIQCRHRKRVTKPQIEKTVTDTTYAADEHEIWLTCPVGTTATNYIAALDKWTIESGEGLSQKLRLDLPRETARLIVRDAFGAQVARDFLGPGGPIGFVSPEDYFAALDDPTRLLRQDLPIVGRSAELNGILAATGDALVKVVVVPGRGGIGKTRLLRSVAERLKDEGNRVLYTLDPALLTAEVIDDLPLEDTVVFVDDAHRPDVSLAPLMVATVRRCDPLTLVLGIRPAGLDQVLRASAQAQLETQQIVVMPRLAPLAPNDVEELAALALGERSERGRRLADATDKLPLLTVLGGRMMARGDFGVAGGAELRNAVLRRFLAEQRGRVTPRVPEDKAQQILVLLAALNPIDTSNETLLKLVADELGVAVSQVRRWLGDTEDAGLLLTRGALRRLTPDILADEVLYEACLDRQGRPTGKAVELWQRYAEHAQTELLANLGELDWRTTADGDSVLDDVWSRLLSGFAKTDAWGREQLIDKIAPAAFFWPARILELVDIALGDPARTTDWGAIEVQIDDASVRGKLPSLLRAVGQHARYVRPAMDRLWLLARDDTRATHAHPDHALRVLRELGGFDFDPAHHAALLDVVDAELAKPELGSHPNSPLLLLESLLEREGTRSRSVGLEWRMSAYFVHPEAARPWRDRVRRILVDQALHGEPRERTVAAKLFEEALRLPHGYFGRSVPADVRDAWKPDQEATLNAIEEVARGTDDASVRVGIVHALDWHAAHSSWDGVSARAAHLIEQLRAEGDDEILAAIASPWSLFEDEEKVARDQRVGARLVERFDTGRALADYLEDLLAQIAHRDISDHPEPTAVLFHVFDASQSHAAEVWDWVVEHPDSRMVVAGSIALGALRRAGENVDERLDAAATSEQVMMRRIAASYLCGGAWFAEASATELRLLESMATDEDRLVRNVIATTLLRLQSSDPDLAVRQALKARIDPDDEHGADMLFSTIHDYGVEKLKAEDVDQLCAQLLSVSDPDYFAHQLMSDLGAVDPRRVVELWIARLRRHQNEDPPRYRPVPFHDYGMEMLGETTGEDRAALHTTLLTELGNFDAWRIRELGTIYWRLALPGLPDDEPADELLAGRTAQLDAALAALVEYLGRSDPRVQSVGDMLFELPWQVLFVRPDWVAQLLETDDAEKHLGDGLHAAAVSGMHGRMVGEDSPRWTATVAGAQAALEQVDSGSAAAALYADLAEMAQREIDKDRHEDDEQRWGWQ